MKILTSILCGLLFLVVSLTVQAQPVTTLSNAELFSRQYAQADTANIIIEKQDHLIQSEMKGENILSKSKNNVSFPYSKCVVFGVLGEVIVGGMGFFVGMSIPDSRKEGGDDLSGLGYALRNGLIGAGIGATIGCAHGVYNCGVRYRKGSYWHALAGSAVSTLLAAGTSHYLTENDKFAGAITITTLAVAPIVSTAAFYIFSEDTIDCK